MQSILIKQKMCQIESQKINSGVTDILTKIRKKENTVIHCLFVTVVKVLTFSKKHLNIRVHSRFECLIGIYTQLFSYQTSSNKGWFRPWPVGIGLTLTCLKSKNVFSESFINIEWKEILTLKTNTNFVLNLTFISYTWWIQFT